MIVWQARRVSVRGAAETRGAGIVVRSQRAAARRGLVVWCLWTWLALGGFGAAVADEPVAPLEGFDVLPEKVLGVVKDEEVAALVAVARSCVGGRAPVLKLTQIYVVTDDALPPGVAGITVSSDEGEGTIFVERGSYEQAVRHEVGHLWFSKGDAMMDEGRAELVNLRALEAQNIPLWTLASDDVSRVPDLTQFSAYSDVGSQEELIAAYDGSRKLFTGLAAGVPTVRLLDPGLHSWADLARVVSTVPDGAAVVADMERGVAAQRALLDDPDHDGAITLVERFHHTDPARPDTDGDGWPDGKPADAPRSAVPLLKDGVVACLPFNVFEGEQVTVEQTTVLSDGRRVISNEVVEGPVSAYTLIGGHDVIMGWLRVPEAPPDRWHRALCASSPAGSVQARKLTTLKPPKDLGNIFGSMVAACADTSRSDLDSECRWLEARLQELSLAVNETSAALADGRRMVASAIGKDTRRMDIVLNADENAAVLGPSPRSPVSMHFTLEMTHTVAKQGVWHDLAVSAAAWAAITDEQGRFRSRAAARVLAESLLADPHIPRLLWWDVEDSDLKAWRDSVARCPKGWKGLFARECRAPY